MSIVHEALKKAHSDPSAPMKPGMGLGPEIEAERGKRRSPMVPLFLLIFALLIAGPVLAPMLTNPSRVGVSGSRPIEASLAQSIGSKRLGQFGLEELPLPKTSFQQAQLPAAVPTGPAVALSGIVYDGAGQNSYCLINGDVFRVGDSIGPMRVLSISKEEVELDHAGQKIILAVGEKA